MIDTILIGLLLASICTTGAFFLKWIAAKNEVRQRDRQIAEMKESHAKEMAELKKPKVTIVGGHVTAPPQINKNLAALGRLMDR